MLNLISVEHICCAGLSEGILWLDVDIFSL